MTRNGCVKMINETMLQGFEWYLPADGKHWQRNMESMFLNKSEYHLLSSYQNYRP